MRPGVYASVMRNRKTSARRVHRTEHKFSWRQCCIMLFIGVVLLIPGIIVTIIGIEHENNLDSIPGDKILYKFIGPAALAIGVGLICASGIYYCCWGFQSPVNRTRHTSKHKKAKENAEQYNPLQTSSVPAISSSHAHHPVSAYSSVRSEGSPIPKSFTGNGDHSQSTPTSPDSRSDRHGNHHHHNTHAHRTSSKSLTDNSSIRSHHSNSRHRSCSYNSHHPHNSQHSSHASQPHQRHHEVDNQVAFVNTDAPLAKGESGSMDISIDIDSCQESEKKY